MSGTLRHSILFCCFYFFKLIVYSQTTLGISGFYVPEKNNLAIGFTSFDVSYPLLQRKQVELLGGLRFTGAFEGSRGGYFAFGYFGEALLFPIHRIQLGWNLATVAGGGAQAPDKDGWMIQNTLFGQYRSSNGFSIRAGLNHTYVSGGFIQGFSPLIGLNWHLQVSGIRDSVQPKGMIWRAVYGEAGFGKFNATDLTFIGTGASYNLGKYIAGDVAFHALVNTHGGYMQILSSLGPSLPIKRMAITPGIVLGLGGGGAVHTQGGGLFGAQLGIHYYGKKFFTGIKYQIIRAVSNRFDYQAGFLSIGKTLQADSKIRWYPLFKTYLGTNGFGNIGARFLALESRYVDLIGSTYWACTDDRGAYAEGLFEVLIRASETFPVYAVFSGGAGAGASINKKTASGIASAGLGFFSPWKKCPLGVEVAYWSGGNIPHWSAAVYYRFQK